uniref:Tubulin-specific chaperone A n=1 Tax=Oncorhynchus tshawytscha TaxID=74940 RepID=A0AAZ3Q7M7_ONCTS
MADPRIRQIKIKTGVVKRLVKEKVMYVKETRQQEEKIERLKAEACDEEADSEARYVIKKQLEVLQESKMMVPDCHRRLTIAHADLSQILVRTAPLGRKNVERNQAHPLLSFLLQVYP